MSNSDSNWEERIRFQWRLKSLVVFVLSVFILSSLLGGWYRSVRSSNALDELYYATVDSDACEEIAHGFTSPDVLLSAASLVKDQDMRAMKGVDMEEHSERYPPIRNNWFLDGDVSDHVSHEAISRMRYSFDNKASREAGATLVDWEASDGWGFDNPKRRYLSICVGLSASAYGDETTEGRIYTSFKYDVDRKVLECRLREPDCIRLIDPSYAVGNIWLAWSDGQAPSEPGATHIGYMRQHNIRVEKAAEDALAVIEGSLLPNFINRGGSTSTHSANIEADGVTVDIDLSQLGQPEGE